VVVARVRYLPFFKKGYAAEEESEWFGRVFKSLNMGYESASFQANLNPGGVLSYQLEKASFFGSL